MIKVRWLPALSRPQAPPCRAGRGAPRYVHISEMHPPRSSRFSGAFSGRRAHPGGMRLLLHAMCLPGMMFLLLAIALPAGCRSSAFRDDKTAVVHISGSGIISVAGRRTSVAGLPAELDAAGVTPDKSIEVLYEGTLSNTLRDSVANNLAHRGFFKVRFVSSRRVDAFITK